MGDQADKPGENLAFDFNDEPQSIRCGAPIAIRNERWEVGDADLPPAPPPRRAKRRIRISDIDDDLDSDALDRNFGRNQLGDRAPDRDDDDFERIRPMRSARRRTGWRRTCAAVRTSFIRLDILSGFSRWWFSASAS